MQALSPAATCAPLWHTVAIMSYAFYYQHINCRCGCASRQPAAEHCHRGMYHLETHIANATGKYKYPLGLRQIRWVFFSPPIFDNPLAFNLKVHAMLAFPLQQDMPPSVKYAIVGQWKSGIQPVSIPLYFFRGFES